MSPDEIKKRIGDRVVVASVSGGKDSGAMSLYLRELGIEHRRVFADTGWEHPKTYDYIRGDLADVIGPIDWVRGLYTMPDLIRKKGMFPSRKHRFCTTLLKVAPLTRYLDEVGDDVLSTVGIRADESTARSKFTEWEDLSVRLKPSEGGPLDWHGEVWRPLLRWTVDEVIAIHKRHGLKPNPVYLMPDGPSRVGCWPCINVRKKELRFVAVTDPARIDEIRGLEAEVLAAVNDRMAAKGTTLEAEGYAKPTYFQASTGRANGGTRGMWTIDEAVAWSHTAHGGRKLELFHEPSDGCARWGMCEAGPDEDAA